MLAFLISTPAIKDEFLADDFVHKMKILGPETLVSKGLLDRDSGTLSNSVMSLFAWQHSEKNITHAMNFGTCPWWTFIKAKVSFWRPLTALTHWLDYTLWPQNASLMYVHNIVWFCGVIALITIFYRQFIQPASIAGLAALLYTLDQMNYSAVSWIASRNSLLSAFWGITALMAHHRWRRQRTKKWSSLFSACLFLALLSGEIAVSVFTYLIGYALWFERGPWHQRALSLLPGWAIMIGWRFIYQELGYGAFGSGLYIDPGVEAFRFLLTVSKQGPIVLFNILGGPSLLTYTTLSPTAQWRVWLLAICFLGVLFFLFFPLLKQNRVARFLATGSVLSVPFACATTLPDERLLFFISLGGIGLIAQFIGAMCHTSDWRSPHGKRRLVLQGLCLLCIGCHLLYPGGYRIMLFKNMFSPSSSGESQLEKALKTVDESQDVIVLVSPNPLAIFYLPFQLASLNKAFPAHLRLLSSTYHQLEITRFDRATLILTAKGGTLIPKAPLSREETKGLPATHILYWLQILNSVFRGKDFPMRSHEIITLPGVDIEVTKLSSNGFPREAIFRFDRLLEDSSLHWVTWNWRKDSYLPFIPPAIGEKVILTGVFQ